MTEGGGEVITFCVERPEEAPERRLGKRQLLGEEKKFKSVYVFFQEKL